MASLSPSSSSVDDLILSGVSPDDWAFASSIVSISLAYSVFETGLASSFVNVDATFDFDVTAFAASPSTSITASTFSFDSDMTFFALSSSRSEARKAWLAL